MCRDESILITGGAGFIGHQVATYLARRGKRALVLDNLCRAQKKHVDQLKLEGIPIIVHDVRKTTIPPEVKTFRPNVIVHLAALISVQESIKRPMLYHQVNVSGTLNMLTVARKLGCTYFIGASSAAIYGDTQNVPTQENQPANPLSPYGATKVAGEAYTNAYQTSEMTTASVRPFNVYGPGQNKPYAGVITHFIDAVKAEIPLTIFCDGLQTRDFVHVTDVAAAIDQLILARAPGTYNLGTGISTSISSLAETVRKSWNSNVKIQYAKSRHGDIKHSVANIDRLRAIGWTPKIPLSTGIDSLKPSGKPIPAV